MTLEDVINQFAEVVGHQTNVAIAEIIRQRDTAQKLARQLKSQRDYYSHRKDELYEECHLKDRQIAALRGVITRMKTNSRRGAGQEREA